MLTPAVQWNDQFGEQCHRRRSTSNTIFFVNATSNTFTDVALILIVLPVIWKLKMNRRPKLALYGIVCLGWLGVAASAIRMIVVSRILKSKDPAWEAADMDIWSCVECNTSLICAAAPCIRPLLNKIKPSLLPSYLRSWTGQGRTDGNKSANIHVTWEMRHFNSKNGKTDISMSSTALASPEIGTASHKEPSSHRPSLDV